MLRSLIDQFELALAGGRTKATHGPSSPNPERCAFSDWLPWSAWMADRQVFVNADALGFCLELRPQSGADEEMANILQSVVGAAPAGTGLQFHLYASPAIREPLARYAALRLPDEGVPEFHERGRAGRHTNLHRVLARRRVSHYLAGATHSLLPSASYLLRHFRLVLSVSLPGHAEDLTRLDELALLRESLRATLHPAGFPNRIWNASDLVNWTSALLDPHRRRGEGLRLHYDEGRELRAQVIEPATQLNVDRDGIRASNDEIHEDLAIRLLSVRAYPPRYALWQMGSLIGDLYQNTLQIPCPFLISLNVHVLDPESTRSWAYLKAARATTNASSTMARFLPDLQDKRADWGIVLKALDDGQHLVDLQHQIALFTSPEDATRCEQAARAVFRARGFELTRDTLMASQALIASLPMTLSKSFHADLKRMKRVTTKTSGNAVHLAPLIAEWPGTGTLCCMSGASDEHPVPRGNDPARNRHRDGDNGDLSRPDRTSSTGHRHPRHQRALPSEGNPDRHVAGQARGQRRRTTRAPQAGRGLRHRTDHRSQGTAAGMPLSRPRARCCRRIDPTIPGSHPRRAPPTGAVTW